MQQPGSRYRLAPVAQSVEHWSYEPEVAGSIPAWSTLSFFLFFI